MSNEDDVLQQVKEQSVYPDELMSEVSKSTMGRTLVISTVLHVALILITSIGFIGLCLKYDTLDPRTAVQEELQAEKEKQKIEAVEKAKPAERTTSQPADTGSDPGEGSDELSPIEQDLEEEDRNYPTGSGVGFDPVDSLEE